MTYFINVLLSVTLGASMVNSDAKLGVILTSTDGDLPHLVESVFTQTQAVYRNSNISLQVVQPGNKTDPFAVLTEVCSAFKELSVAVTFLTCYQDRVLSGFLAKLEIPHVSITPSCGNEMTPWTLRVQPKREFIFDVLYDIMNYERIKLFILVHDDSTDYTLLNKFIRQFSNSTTGSNLLDIGTTDSLWRNLRSPALSVDVTTVIVLVLNCFNTIKTLSQAEKLQLTETKLRWVVANDEVLHEAYKTDAWKNGNIIFVQNHYIPRKISPCNSVVLNNTLITWENKTVRLLDQQYLSDAILLATEALSELEDRGQVFNKNLSCWKSTTSVNNSKNPFNDPVYSTIEQKIHGKDGYSTDVEYVVRGIDSNWLTGHMSSVTTAIWTPSVGLKLLREEVFTETYNNFEGLPMKVMMIFLKPYAYPCTSNSELSSHNYCGLCIHILDEMARILNFTIDPIPTDGPIGSDENGNWNGMVGAIMNQEVDIAIGPISVTYDRSKVIDYTNSYSEDPAAILLRKARPSSILRVFTPFSVETWVLVIVSTLLLPILLWMVEKMSPLRGGGPYSEDKRSPQGLVDVMWQFFATWCLQGGDYRHRSLSGRSLVVFWVLFSIITNSTYTAILTAILTVSTDFAPISNLQDLAINTQYIPLVMEGSNLHTLFKNANAGTTYGKIWEKMKDQTLPTSVTGAVEQMRQNEYLAFMSDRSVLQYLLKEPDYCHEFALAAESFNPTGLAFMVPRAAPYKTQLSRTISHLQEGGFIENWLDKLWRINPECLEDSDNDANVIGVRSVMGALVVILAALGAGIIILIVEKLAWYLKRNVFTNTYGLKWAKPVNYFKKRNESESSIDDVSNNTEVMSQSSNGSRFDLRSIRSRRIIDGSHTTHM